ncbi:MAG: sulfatase [Acidobacteriota bacterium]
MLAYPGERTTERLPGRESLVLALAIPAPLPASGSPARPRARAIAGSRGGLLCGIPIALAVAGWLVPEASPPRAGHETAPPRMARPPFPSAPIVLLTIDTLRASHMSLYGYERPTTPRIDRWAAGQLAFTQAFTPKSSTAPALASLHTGLYPFDHGLYHNTLALPAANVTLAEILSRSGYRCGAFVANAVVSDVGFGLDQGFRDWRSYSHAASPELLGDAARWIGARRKGPFLAWIHIADPHSPYTPPPPFDRKFLGDPFYGRRTGMRARFVKTSPRDGELNLRDVLGARAIPASVHEGALGDYLEAQYDGEVAYTDSLVAPFLAFVRQRFPGALIVLAADHGESMVEHREMFSHGRHCYDTTAWIPLVVSHPALAPGRSDRIVSLVDVLPTLCDLVGVVPPERSDGVSFAAVVVGGHAAAPEPERMVEVGGGHLRSYAPIGLRSARYKLIASPRRAGLIFDDAVRLQLRATLGPVPERFARMWRLELYDVKEDPLETVNALRAMPDVAREARDRLWTVIAREESTSATGGATGAAPEIGAKTMEELKTLGYVH